MSDDVTTQVTKPENAESEPAQPGSMKLRLADLLEWCSRPPFGDVHGLMRWASIGAGAKRVDPALTAIADGALAGEPVYFELRVGKSRFVFEFE